MFKGGAVALGCWLGAIVLNIAVWAAIIVGGVALLRALRVIPS
jgi:hypothetical protein